MKCETLLLALALGIHIPNVVSQLVLPNFFNRRSDSVNAAAHCQEPIMNVPNIALPASDDQGTPSGGADDVIISDVIGAQRVINIFAGFTRDIDTISKRLDDNTQNTTVLAPLNSEIQKLPRKPWEDPNDYKALGQSAYDGKDGEDRAHRNLRRFIEAHMIPVSPWKEGEKVESLGGGKVWWEGRGDKRTVYSADLAFRFKSPLTLLKIQPGNIEVSSIANRVSNGEVWVIKGALNYE